MSGPQDRSDLGPQDAPDAVARRIIEAAGDIFLSYGDVGLFRAGLVRGRVAQIGHALLYRGRQAGLHSVWCGTLIWLVDRLAGLAAPRFMVD